MNKRVYFLLPILLVLILILIVLHININTDQESSRNNQSKKTATDEVVNIKDTGQISNDKNFLVNNIWGFKISMPEEWYGFSITKNQIPSIKRDPFFTYYDEELENVYGLQALITDTDSATYHRDYKVDGSFSTKIDCNDD